MARQSVEYCASDEKVKGWLGHAQESLQAMIAARAESRRQARDCRERLDLATAAMVLAGCSLTEAVDYVDQWVLRTQGLIMDAFGNPDVTSVPPSPGKLRTSRVPGSDR